MPKSESGKRSHQEDRTAEDNARAKKPYNKPSFQWERVFETQALICGKVNIGVPVCSHNHKTS